MATVVFGSLAISQVDASTIADLLPHGPWQSVIDDQNRSDYAREQRATLRYCGSDPLLAGAALDCWVRERDVKYEWRANLHAGGLPRGGGQDHKYIPDTLPYKERDNFVSSINISATKPLPRIAKELSTRLLAHYLPAYRHAMVRLQEDTAQKVADQALATELAALLRSEVDTRHGQDGTRVYKGRLWPLSVNHGRVQLERGFTMSPQQARDLCALVATWPED